MQLVLLQVEMRVRVNLDFESGALVYAPGWHPYSLLDVLALSKAEICVVDIDAAKGRPAQLDLVQGIACRFPGRCIISGGLRTPEDAQRMLTAGYKSIIVGSALFGEFGLNIPVLGRFAELLPPHVWEAAIDHREGRVVTAGFGVKTGLTLVDMVHSLLRLTAHNTGICITDADAAEEKRGLDVRVVSDLLDVASGRRLWAGGGIREARQIRYLNSRGIGAIVGRSFFSPRKSSMVGHILGSRDLVKLLLSLQPSP